MKKTATVRGIAPWAAAMPKTARSADACARPSHASANGHRNGAFPYRFSTTWRGGGRSDTQHDVPPRRRRYPWWWLGGCDGDRAAGRRAVPGQRVLPGDGEAGGRAAGPAGGRLRGECMILGKSWSKNQRMHCILHRRGSGAGIVTCVSIRLKPSTRHFFFSLTSVDVLGVLDGIHSLAF